MLILSDGSVFNGTMFGAPAPAVQDLAETCSSDSLRNVGEVVFNTAMSGYGEVLTDPSYTGQIVVMTYPHAGNYGIDEFWSETGPEAGSEADPDRLSPRPVKPAAMIVRSLYDGPVPPGREKLSDYLLRNGIPGITGVDTRALTLEIRDRGSRNGLVCRPAGGADSLSSAEREMAVRFLQEFPPMEGRSLIGEVGTREAVRLPGGNGPHLALYDCGTKANIIRELQALGCTITLVPSTASAGEIRDTGADALMLSNGPGDPAVLKHQVEQTRALLGHIPLLGICLGHQIIAEAAGARTSKMKFGHHGVNHPVREEIPPGNRDTGRVFVTSQNHGFTVDEETLPPGMHVWFRNANDGSVEGLRDDALRVRTTQFHPESAPGPTDSRWIFSAFLEAI